MTVSFVANLRLQDGPKISHYQIIKKIVLILINGKLKYQSSIIIRSY